jgi:hypothetical protein
MPSKPAKRPTPSKPPKPAARGHAAVDLAAEVLAFQKRWQPANDEGAEVPVAQWRRLVALAEQASQEAQVLGECSVRELVGAVEVLDRSTTGFDGWAAGLVPAYRAELLNLARARGAATLADWAKLLVGDAAKQAMEQASGRRIGDPLVSEAVANGYAGLVADLLNTEPTTRFVRIDANRRDVSAHSEFPGNAKGVLTLKVANRTGDGGRPITYRDTAGRVTADSVRAWLLGLPPYNPAVRR